MSVKRRVTSPEGRSRGMTPSCPEGASERQTERVAQEAQERHAVSAHRDERVQEALRRRRLRIRMPDAGADEHLTRLEMEIQARRVYVARRSMREPDADRGLVRRLV